VPLATLRVSELLGRLGYDGPIKMFLIMRESY
jgi:hypothetical protein